MVDKKYIVKLQGKEFVLYDGLLNEAHKQGLFEIYTELIQLPNDNNNNTCIAKATVKLIKGEQVKTFTGYGDANPKNVNRLIALHMIRMAETRAKARALRDATNIGLTAFEELGNIDEIIGSEAPKRVEAKQKADNRATTQQLKKLFVLAKQAKLSNDELKDHLMKNYGVASSKELTQEQLNEIFKELETVINNMKK